MNFVTPSMPKNLLISEDEDEAEDDNEKENDVEEPEVPVPIKAARPKKRGRGSRRKTAGDEIISNEKPKAAKRRKTMWDIPSSDVSSSFHTQTLTQMLPKNGDGQEEVWQLNDSEGDENAGPVIETPKKPKDHASSKFDDTKAEQGTVMRSSVPSLTTSTPTNRPTTAVVPSSTSPETPILIRRYSLAPHGSPLIARSSNVTAPSSIIKNLRKTPKDQVIPDSYGTVHSSPTTPTQRSTTKATPTKKLRFQLPEDKENITPGRTSPKLPKPIRKTPGRQPLREVPDIDGDEETEDDEGEESTSRDENAPSEPKSDEIPSTDDFEEEEEEEEAETCYGAIGEETQAQLLSTVDELGLELGMSGSREPTPSRSPTPTPKPKEKQSAIPQAKKVSPTTPPASSFVVEQTPVPPPQKGLLDNDTTRAHTQIYTQVLQSQRVPLEDIQALGPQAQNSDIFLPLHPEPLAKILHRTKNHEFRTWMIPPTVCRVWIYSTSPICELKYMCVFGPAKVPGEIEDESGIGNAEFNERKKDAKFAYEILQVYELNNPVSLKDMKDRGWVRAAPQKFNWVLPAIAGELTANLKCALFGEEEAQEGEAALTLASSPNATESQELRAQLQSDVDYSTQHPSSERVVEVISSSQVSRKSASKMRQTRLSDNFAKPAIPRAPSGSSARAQAGPASQRVSSFMRASQATTASSPAVSPEKSLPRAAATTSDPVAINLQSSSPTMYRNTRNHSLRSSQFMSRSQMLPESLVNDEIQGPPSIIWDSADEQSD